MAVVIPGDYLMDSVIVETAVRIKAMLVGALPVMEETAQLANIDFNNFSLIKCNSFGICGIH